MKYTIFIANCNPNQGNGHLERTKRVIKDFDNIFSQPILVEFKENNFYYKYLNKFTNNFERIDRPVLKSEIALIIDSYEKVDLRNFLHNFKVIWTASLEDRTINKINKTKYKVNVDLSGNERVDAYSVLIPNDYIKDERKKEGCVIMLGGSTNITVYEQLMKYLSKNKLLNKRLGIVYTGNNQKVISLINNNNFLLCNKRERIASFIKSFQYGIGTGGLGWFERIASGVGQVVIPTSKNEKDRADLILNKYNGFKMINVDNLKDLIDIKLTAHEEIEGLDGNGTTRISNYLNLIWATEGSQQTEDVLWHESSTFFIDKFLTAKNYNFFYKKIIKNLEELKEIDFLTLQLKILDTYNKSQLEKRSIPLFVKKNNKESIEIIVDRRSWIKNNIFYVIENLIKHNINIYLSSNHKNESITKEKFLIGYHEIIEENYLNDNNNWLIIHESNLPNGKGWSPMTWGVLEGKSEFIGTLFKASSKVDEGKIVCKSIIKPEKITLVDDLRYAQLELITNLILTYLGKLKSLNFKPDHQTKVYKKRSPKDSFLKLTDEQIKLFKVANNTDYPLWTILNSENIKIYLKRN